MPITGLDQHEVKMIGGYKANINVDDVKIETEVHVIPNNAIQYDVILGQPLLQNSTKIVDRNILKLVTLNTTNEMMREEREEEKRDLCAT